MGKKVLLVFPLLSFLSCKETVTEVQKETVTENIFICCLQSGNSTGELIADSVQSPATSSVTMGWGANSRIFPFKTIEPGKLVFRDTTKLNSSIVYTIQFASLIGNAGGTITMPDSTSIITPEPEEVVPSGSGISVKWRKISGADFYKIAYQGGARDAAGNTSIELLSQYAFISDTSFTIPDSYFNLPDTSYNVSINVAPYVGPDIKPNSTPNMSGSVKGFLYAFGGTVNVNCCYGTSQCKGKTENKPVVLKNSDLKKILEVFENTKVNSERR